MTETPVGGTAKARPVIDFHAHVLVPDVYAVAAEHNIFSELPTDPGVTEAMRDQIRQRAGMVLGRMSDLTDRIAKMDAMGVDIQVLTASLVHQGLEWADAQTSLRLARTTNDWIAAAVAARPDRLIGLGTLPLHLPSLAVAELERCMRELGLRGVGISSTAGVLELGDPQLAPFWAKAEELGAVIYIHPGGNRDRRFKRFHLWNSVGQAFEEAMAVASLIYDGVLERHPGLKICVSHGGGYMPYYMGRIDRNYIEKANTRVNMSKPPIEYLRMMYFDSCVYDRAVLTHSGRQGRRRSCRARLGLSGGRDQADRVRARHRGILRHAEGPDRFDQCGDAAGAGALMATSRSTIEPQARSAPSPLVGEGWGGGSCCDGRPCNDDPHPPPLPTRGRGVPELCPNTDEGWLHD